jgi:serine/threonine protein kinase
MLPRSQKDSEPVFRCGWRLDEDGKQCDVLIVASAADHPSRSTLDQFRREYELKDELDGTWAVRPLELVREANRTMLVLDDLGGEPLDRLLGEPMDIWRFCRGSTIASALGKLHQRGLVHKDVKPANVLFNEATGEVRLTMFGIAPRFACERQSPHPPETIAGTLAYTAPEQTGRMNRSIDSRSDSTRSASPSIKMLTGCFCRLLPRTRWNGCTAISPAGRWRLHGPDPRSCGGTTSPKAWAGMRHRMQGLPVLAGA